MRKAGHWGGWHSQEMASALLFRGPGLSAEDLWPRGCEAVAGQALSSPLTLRCARLPPQLGLWNLVPLWRGSSRTQLMSWTPDPGVVWPPLGDPEETLHRPYR